MRRKQYYHSFSFIFNTNDHVSKFLQWISYNGKKKTVFEQNCSKFKTNASYFWDQIVYQRIHFFKKGLLNLSGNWCQSKRNCNNYCPDWNLWLTEISDWLTLLKIQLTNNHLIISLYFTNAFQPKAIQHICKATLCFG